MADPYDFPDAYQQLSDEAYGNRLAYAKGRGRTMQQLQSADIQKDREETRDRLQRIDQGMRPVPTVEGQLYEENQARQQQQKINEFSKGFDARNPAPPPPEQDAPSNLPGADELMNAIKNRRKFR